MPATDESDLQFTLVNTERQKYKVWQFVIHN